MSRIIIFTGKGGVGKTSVAVATACKIDLISENETAWVNIKEYFEKIMLLRSEKSIETEELLVFPGFEDLLSLLKIKEFYDQGYYDVLIVDCAPTGETMSILKFPELFKWWMVKNFRCRMTKCLMK